jgi:nucleotide-binding universal stress UspA family protein
MEVFVMYQRILVTTDGSATAIKGVTEACALAKALGARLEILHVVDTRPIYADYSGISGSAQLFAEQSTLGATLLAEAVAVATEAHVSVATHLVESSTEGIADAILRTAASLQSELIVMGTHGRSGLQALIFGSDAEAVLHHSPVPVLLVRCPD